MRKGTTSSMSKLAQLQAERGLGLRELAELNIRQIQGIEGGSSKVENTSLRNALALADALGIHPRDLI